MSDEQDAFRVHVVDDDESVRRALCRLLSSRGFEVQRHDSAEAFLGEFDPDHPGCAIVDMCLPRLSGFDLQQRLATVLPDFPVLFLTGRGDIDMGVKAMKGGAFDFLTKPVQPTVLLNAISAAKTRVEDMAAIKRDEALYERRLQSLTVREAEVLDAVVSGNLNKQIAHELGIAEKTVKVHRSRVMKKMGMRNIADLVRASVTRRIDTP